MIGNPTYSYYKGKRTNLNLYYICQAYRRGAPCDLTGVRFRVDWVDSLAWEWVRGLLSNSVVLEVGLREYQEQQETITQPLRERLAVIDDMLRDIRSRLGCLLDLYLAGDFEREALTDRKARLEQERDCLQVEQERLT